MRRTTASTDEKRHAACRTRPQTGVIQRALEYAMGIHDHRRWRLRRVLVGRVLRGRVLLASEQVHAHHAEQQQEEQQ